jgi:hypothetical protein
VTLNRRGLLKLAGLAGVAPLYSSSAIADEGVCPPCPDGHVYLEVQGEHIRIGLRIYRPCRRYRVRACYERLGKVYRVSIHGLSHKFRFSAHDPGPSIPERGLRTAIFCLRTVFDPKCCKVVVKSIAGIPAYGSDCVSDCPPLSDEGMAARARDGEEVLTKLCKVTCSDGTEAWIPANDPDACFDCPDDGCLPCPRVGGPPS